MKKLLLLVVFIIVGCSSGESLKENEIDKNTSSFPYNYKQYQNTTFAQNIKPEQQKNNNLEVVSGYCRKDGTCVNPYVRTKRDDIESNNLSYKRTRAQ